MIDDRSAQVVGRYAPSPTGDLHFGSLVAAVASFCHAKAQGGLWRLRMDDLDQPRVVAGAAERILATLAAFGLTHDGPVIYQSERGAAYAAALDRLIQQNDAFDCACTRREARQGPPGIEGPIYPGTCRNGLPPGRRARSVRLRVGEARVRIDDALQGVVEQALGRDIGDFVVRRADGITAYQLATVVDDAAQGVTEVVRGADLLSSAPRQEHIRRCLGHPPVAYLHTPLVVDANGDKLGKSTGAPTLVLERRAELLIDALEFLGQPISAITSKAEPDAILAAAVANWLPSLIPARATRVFRATG